MLLGKIDPAESPTVLADHLAAVLVGALRSHGLDGNLDAQIRFCNRLIQSIATSNDHLAGLTDESVDTEARQLLEVIGKSEGLLGPRATPRPTIPISQDALLVAAKHELRLVSELFR
mgnify:FL=1